MGSRAARTERERAEADFQACKGSHEGLRRELEACKAEMANVQTQLDLVDQREKNKLAPFGRNMEQVLAEIGRARWYGQTPVGPLGRFVRVREAKWAPVMRVRLGNLMSAFAITDSRDRKNLDQILRKHGKCVGWL